MNQYEKELAHETSMLCMKALKILNEIDHNMVFVEGCNLENEVIEKVQDLLLSVNQSLYEKSFTDNGEKDD